MTLTLEEVVKEHKDESDSSKSDRHWKRPKRSYQSPLNNHLEGLIALGSDESLIGPHTLDSAIEEVGTSKTPVSKSAEQYLRPSALLEEIRRGKMKVEGKDIESIQGRCHLKAPLQKVSLTHAPLKIFVPPLNTFKRQTTSIPKPYQWVDKGRQLDEKTSVIKEALTLMDQLRGDAQVLQERVVQLSLEKKELEETLEHKC
ncbi:hypothetical protein E5676_scaffold480G00690 [Cucumis melo var. makuwa]|uniref:Uncharacterized protein n=1 Tax=Cucumis melo var. makuwa TaxID=1194695 RepID=A0A5A7UI92_CUCMM|nr:hypothetical protein E6C27_scaffold318G00430 [Cucumis melo var. makuwa]TYK20681.1 hypothetical protein E5676_scaffold480G00690 [Cucumis melo var. makuwa]